MERARGRGSRWLLSAAALLTVAVFGAHWAAQAAGDKEREEAAAKLREQNAPAYELSRSFGKAAEFVLPAVVNITVEKKLAAPGRMPLPPGFENWPFRLPPQFRRMPEMPGEEPEFKMPGVGSGFVIDAGGYVVTNWHVVKDAELKDITVLFADGKEFQPTKVLHDARTDLAVLKIEGDRFPSLELGDSADVLPGQMVLAVGSPSGFGFSVSGGVVSATSTMNRFMAGKRAVNFRASDDPYAQEDYIQTDTTINPGNSGGPLVDLYGRVLGVNTLIFSRTGQYGGLAFAVPSNKVRSVVDQLIKEGKVQRGHLGVQIVDVSELDDPNLLRRLRYGSAEELAKALKVTQSDTGAFVVEVLDGTPAGEAGMADGDLIQSFDGQKITDVNSLRRTVADTPPGKKVKVIVKRKGETKTLEVTVGEQPTPEALQAMAEPTTKLEDYGIEVQDLTPDLAKTLGIETDRGVVITDIKEGSPAEREKLTPGTVILNVQVEGVLQPVRGVRDLTNVLRKAGKEGVTLRVSHRGSVRFVVLKP